MTQAGDAKGEYRGTTERDDAALDAWLAKRATEAVLEPDLPIIDPHHHFWDSPHRGHYLLPELLDDIGGGHNIVSTVFLECRAMYRKDGPREMAALGGVEFVTGIAAMNASGGSGLGLQYRNDTAISLSDRRSLSEAWESSDLLYMLFPAFDQWLHDLQML